MVWWMTLSRCAMLLQLLSPLPAPMLPQLCPSSFAVDMGNVINASREDSGSRQFNLGAADK
jgi:hypothetical protein